MKKLLIILLILISNSVYGVERRSINSTLDHYSYNDYIGTAPYTAIIQLVGSDTLYIPKLQTDSVIQAGVDIAGHISKTIDPHGANEQITESLTLGSGTTYISISKASDGYLHVSKLRVDDLQYVCPDLENHLGKTVDPHGANEQITESITIGSGSAVIALTKDSSGDIKASSYWDFDEGIRLIQTATPTASPGRIFFDGGHFFGYNGTAWKQLDN